MLSIAKCVADFLNTIELVNLSEIPVLEDDSRILPRPSDYAQGGIYVARPDLDLSAIDQACLTVSLGDAERTAVTMDETEQVTIPVYVGHHCTSEAQLEIHARWSRLVLGLAFSTAASGGLLPGIPFKGIRHQLFPESGGIWHSMQKGWYESPAPVVYRAGAVVTPDSIDYDFGSIVYAAAETTDDMRADFTCGILPIEVRQFIRPDLENPAKLSQEHNGYLICVATFDADRVDGLGG